MTLWPFQQAAAYDHKYILPSLFSFTPTIRLGAPFRPSSSLPPPGFSIRWVRLLAYYALC